MTPKEYFYNKAFCTLPWIGVYVDPSGNVRNCAISTENLGNIHSSALGDIVNNQLNADIKQDMSENRCHSRCDVCYDVDKNAKNPSLSESNRNWYKKIAIKHVGLDFYANTHNHAFKVLDLRWRNTCNQACVYCGPDLSSRWASELGEKIEISDLALKNAKDHIFQHIDQVRHVYLAGGEPLLIKENEELLDLLWKHNPDVEIRVNTNLSNINGPVFKKLSGFQNVKWTVSVDAIEERYEYIRWPGNWGEFLANLRHLQTNNLEVNYNMVWCILNAYHIFDCIDFLLENNSHENMFIIQCLNAPSSLSVMNLPQSEIDHLLELINERLDRCQNKDWWLYKSLISMYNFIKNYRGESDLKSTFTFLEELDLRRKLSSQSVFPELYKLK